MQGQPRGGHAAGRQGRGQHGRGSAAALCSSLKAGLDLHGDGRRLQRRLRGRAGQGRQAALGRGAGEGQALLVAHAACIAQRPGALGAAAPLRRLVRSAVAARHAARPPRGACSQVSNVSVTGGKTLRLLARFLDINHDAQNKASCITSLRNLKHYMKTGMEAFRRHVHTFHGLHLSAKIPLLLHQR